MKVGQPAAFTVDAYPDKVFSGRVTQVRKSAEITQSVVTYTAVVSATNPDFVLFPGMTARLNITGEETKDALKVPNAALRFRPEPEAVGATEGAGLGSTTVWVARKPGEVLPVHVTIGKSDDSETQLLSGDLKEGDPIIVSTAGRS